MDKLSALGYLKYTLDGKTKEADLSINGLGREMLR